MQESTFMTSRRFIGLTLIASFLLFWGGAAFSIPLVDNRGNSIYVLPPQQVLPVIAAHSLFWQWQTLFQMAGGVVAALGLGLLMPVLGATNDRKASLSGLMLFCFSIMSWIIIEAFRLATATWATQAVAGSVLAFYQLSYLWIENALFALSIALAFCALAAYGGALIITAIVPRWAGWTIFIYACACLILIIFVRTTFIPPELVYPPAGLLGVLLLRRPGSL